MDKVKNIRVLILEDDLETVEVILRVLRGIETDKYSFGVTVIPDYLQVEEFINKNPQIEFDILLLDRDCFLGGSLHNVDLGLFDINKVISISSVPEYNAEAESRGVKRIVPKDYRNLDDFAERLKKEILDVI